jgi:lipopolysaccharide transport system permease protein
MPNQSDLPIQVYTPDSQMRSPRRLMEAMWQDLKASRELAWRLFIRDLSSMYRQSLFGVVWAFVPPLVTSLIFILLQSRNIINFGETEIPYPVYVLVSVLLWQVFTESLNGPLKSVTASKPFLVKINFPREALILSSFYFVVFNLLIKTIILAAIFLIFQIPPTWGLILAIIPVFMLIFLGFGIGLVLTPLGMLYADVGTSLPLATQLLFFLTPVVYPPPTTFPLSLIVYLNPISPLLIAARDLITTGAIYNPVSFFITSGLTIILLFSSWVVYRVALPIVIERISA